MRLEICNYSCTGRRRLRLFSLSLFLFLCLAHSFSSWPALQVVGDAKSFLCKTFRHLIIISSYFACYTTVILARSVVIAVFYRSLFLFRTGSVRASGFWAPIYSGASSIIPKCNCAATCSSPSPMCWVSLSIIVIENRLKFVYGFAVYIGGLVGFFLGCSALSLTEIIYYFTLRLVRRIFCN